MSRYSMSPVPTKGRGEAQGVHGAVAITHMVPSSLGAARYLQQQ